MSNCSSLQGMGLDDDVLVDEIFTWDVRTWSKALPTWEGGLGSSAPLTCLEIGAGPGGPSLWLALKGHTVVCSNRQDTEQMAAPLHEKYSVREAIEYRDIDATDIPYENHFDIIIFKSVLGGIGAAGGLELQQAAMQQMLKALKPGGRLLFAENLRATPVHRLARAIAYRIRRSSWRFMTLRELERMLGGFARHEVHTTGALGVFGTTEQRRRTLGALDDAFASRLTPKRWRYVAYGVATK